MADVEKKRQNCLTAANRMALDALHSFLARNGITAAIAATAKPALALSTPFHDNALTDATAMCISP
jgi:hypothetical protein